MSRSLSEHESTELGRYLMHAVILDLNFSQERFYASVRRFTETTSGDLQAAGAISPLSIKGSGFGDLDEVLPFLTLQHERQHHVTLLSSTTGLLTWRCLNALVSTVQYVLRILRQSSLRDKEFLPLRPWFDREGKRLLRGDVRFSKEAFPPGIENSTKNAHELLAMYLASKFTEIDVLMRFVAAFNGDEDLSASAFCALANRATEILRERFELDDVSMEWSATNMHGESYLPEPRFTTTQIIEADARLRELEVLIATGATADQVVSWQSRFIQGHYAPAFEWLMSRLGNAAVARAAIAVALCGPVDLASAKAVQSGRVLLEDAMPAWRLTRVVSALREMYWPTERRAQSTVISSTLADTVQIPSPAAVLKAIAAANISDPASYSRDAVARGHDEWNTAAPYCTFIEQQFRIYFEKFRSDAMSVIWPISANSDKPLIEFFADGVVVNAYHEERKDTRLVFLAMNELIRGLACLTFVDTLDVSVLLRYEERFNSLAMPDPGSVARSKLIDAKSIVASIIGADPPVAVTWE